MQAKFTFSNLAIPNIKKDTADFNIKYTPLRESPIFLYTTTNIHAFPSIFLIPALSRTAEARPHCNNPRESL